MNTQKAKQANEMTNRELFEELKERGFFMFDKLRHTGNEQYVLVSTKKPTKNVCINHKTDENIPQNYEYVEIHL
ncbi:hypothetical protein [Chryseobacterium sp. Mn2064]|uniref:hypothetical protein n=1 Tax=Chryseobacterium sp. Mn2064 TaxID=3395263 RepID=UPI003BCC85B1